ncbi:MAG: SPOR domain-containing protein [Candidatus Sericytochromatia bacterium]|nr:SPOR domain-containing protein [Candidatus Tanganyikabacteria bacterium]
MNQPPRTRTRTRSLPPGAKPPGEGRLTLVLYWVFLIICAGGAFAGGFLFTYGYTSGVAKRDIAPGLTPPPIMKETPYPVWTPPTPSPSPTADPLFATDPEASEAPSGETPEPAPRATRRPTPAPDDDEGLLSTGTLNTPTPAPEEVYRVWVGQYEQREAAEDMILELQAAGVQAVVVSDGRFYRAQIGAYTSRERALAVAEEVNLKGYGVIIRH